MVFLASASKRQSAGVVVAIWIVLCGFVECDAVILFWLSRAFLAVLFFCCARVCVRLCERSLRTMLLVFSEGDVRRGCALWIVAGVLCCSLVL